VQPPRLDIAPCPHAEVERLQRELDVSGAFAQVLVRRGLGEPGRARGFLAADEEHPPERFEGIGEAVGLVLAHIARRERITVHGDYDVDGVCATAVLVRALGGLGADVDSYLPDRATDGYGLGHATVRRLAARGTRLLITVDCAITAVEEVQAARDLGMEVLVSDHHAPRSDGRLPRAPLVHPRLCGYPCPDLCATAVAHKLAQAVWRAAGRDPRALEGDLDLVALATVADVVPLLGENRALARRGLEMLARTCKPGLRALMGAARVDPASLTARSLAFSLAPRLNAAGRLRRADAGLELVLTDSPARALEVAAELDRDNRERRLVEGRIRQSAEAQIAALGERTAYVLAADDWHAGVIGIVASRLSERHRRPVVLIALGGETGKGSGRSVEGFDLLAGLSACSEHLLRFGGHRAAAGVEIERARVAGFAAALCDHAERVIAPEQLAPAERVDAIVGGDELGMTLAEELARLEPFGHANPTPSLLVTDATFADRRAMGEGKHVRFTVHSRGARARAVAFGQGTRLPVADGESAGATFTLEVNEWAGVCEPRLVLRQAWAEQPPAEAPAAPPQPGSRELSVASRAQDVCDADGEAEAQSGELVLFSIP
jgi:single-stranded-DNA-specific exonuclease